MKLLFVIDSLGSGGAQRQMVNLASGLTAREHRIDFFVYHPEYKHFSGDLEQLNVSIYQHNKRSQFSLSPVWALQKLLCHQSYDASLAYLATPSLYAEICHIALPWLPLVVSERSVYFKKLTFGTRLLQQGHRMASHVVVNSHHQRERMERTFSWMIPKISTIYNGIDLKTFSPSCTGKAIPSKNKLLVISTIVANKNPLGLIKALSIYNNGNNNDCCISWAGKIGQDPASQHEFRSADKLLVELGLKENWTWLGERQDIVSLIQSHDALIHPSFYEGLPNAVCEALACGKPVLVSNVCDHPRLIQENISGFLFDPNDPEDMAGVIQKFLSLSQSEKQKMGSAGRQFAEQNLSIEQLAVNYEKLFLNLRKAL